MARDRKLNTDERILWGKVARSTRPMPGKKDELAELDAFLTEAEVEQQTPAAAKRAACCLTDRSSSP